MPDKPKALPFCIVKETGQPLPAPSDKDIRCQLEPPPQGAMHILMAAKADAHDRQFALSPGLNPERLSSAGWGVLFGPQVSDAIKDALEPLLAWRKEEGGRWFFRFEGDTGYRSGQSAQEWICLRGGSFAGADPRDGVPYYLMIVAAPDDIPFEFQYDVDLQWAVGRLWFDLVEDFAAYAQSVVEQERRKAALRPQELALVATRHAGDAATQMFHDYVATPLDQGKDAYDPIGAATGFAHVPCLGPMASRDAILALLRRAQGAPALLLTGSHGLGLGPDDAGLLAQQGAIVCADWPGYGPVLDDHVLSAHDVPQDADVAGMIHVFFACYGAGCPRTDNFSRHLPVPPTLAPKPFIAALPQALLAHPKGSALAVIGHIERAWSYSFLNEYGQPRLNLFRDVLTALMQGARVGHAMDRANTIWAIHSTRLSDLIAQRDQGDPDFDSDTLDATWIARDDARNLVVLGDPAVRLSL